MDESKFIELLNRQQETKLSVQEFCSNEGIAKSSFYYWKKKLKKNVPPKGFIPLVLKQSRCIPQRHIKDQPISTCQGQMNDDTLLEIIYPNGTMIRVKKDLDISRLRALIYLCD